MAYPNMVFTINGKKGLLEFLVANNQFLLKAHLIKTWPTNPSNVEAIGFPGEQGCSDHWIEADFNGYGFKTLDGISQASMTGYDEGTIGSFPLVWIFDGAQPPQTIVGLAITFVSYTNDVRTLFVQKLQTPQILSVNGDPFKVSLELLDFEHRKLP